MSRKNLVIILVGSLIALVGIGVFVRTLNLCVIGNPICDPLSPSHPSRDIFPSMFCLSLFGLFIVWIGIRNVRYAKSKAPAVTSSNDLGKNNPLIRYPRNPHLIMKSQSKSRNIPMASSKSLGI